MIAKSTSATTSSDAVERGKKQSGRGGEKGRKKEKRGERIKDGILMRDGGD